MRFLKEITMKGLTAEDILGEWSGSCSYEKPDGQTKDEPVYLLFEDERPVGAHAIAGIN